MRSAPHSSTQNSAGFADLRDYFREHRGAVVAYSGGVDSALVLSAAVAALGDRALGVTAVAPAVPDHDLELARSTAERIGARHELVDSNELARPGYVENSSSRCFHCKSELYDLLEPIRLRESAGIIANGTNQDDLGDFRPGLEAARLAGVHSPLVACGFSKADVRRVARELGLPIWDRPAAPCLASRIPFGSRVSVEKLKQIEQAEAWLRRLGFEEMRVRHHGETARIEVPPARLAEAARAADELVAGIKALGFRFVVLDLAGLQSGVFNPDPSPTSGPRPEFPRS